MAPRPASRLLEPFFAAVAMILAITVVALPASPKRAEMDSQLLEALGMVRTAVWHYGLDHPGPGGLVPLAPDGEVATLLKQLLRSTDRLGRTHRPAGRPEARFYGPYLEALPVNPRNGLATLRIAGPEETRPVADGSAGWIYLPATGAVHADLPWADGRGVPYVQY